MDDASAPISAKPATAEHPRPAGIESLKKMSTTAGLGSGDYAAVNTLAVAALMGALLGGLALFTELLLVLPLAAIVCAIVALRQISASNGTQTGKLIAVAAIVISLGITGYVIGSRVVAGMQNKPDQEKLLALIAELDQRMAARDYAGAYQLTTPQFQSRINERRWVDTMLLFEGIADNGGIAGVSWNQTSIVYQDDPQSSLKKAWVGTLFKYRKGAPPNRIVIGFLRQDGKWLINELEALFKT